MILQRIIENPYSKEARVLELGNQYGYFGTYLMIKEEMPIEQKDLCLVCDKVKCQEHSYDESKEKLPILRYLLDLADDGLWHGAYPEFRLTAKDNPRTYGNGKYLLQWGFKYEGKEYWEDDVLTDGYIIEWGEEEAGFYLFENNAARTHYIQNMGDLEVIGNLALNPELKSKLEG